MVTNRASIAARAEEALTPEPSSPPGVLDQAEIERLAALSPTEYDRQRKGAAEQLGVRQSTLDKQVAARHKDTTTAGIEWLDIEPWPHAIEPASVLTEVADTVRRFIVCAPETAQAVALWTAMTWVMDAVSVAPLAVITAPEKRCGKSQLLAVLGKLVRRPLVASNISAPAVFRSIDAWAPTLLVDEADAFMRENEELRGLLNCGHTRDSAYVVRVVGDDLTPVRFSVWGAKAIAGIGHLADTLMDRAVVLELRRKLPHEVVDRLRYAEPDLFGTLAAKLSRFAEDYSDQVRCARPDLPGRLNDRAQDNWEPLLAIAQVAGGGWPGWARTAALKLSGGDGEAASLGEELLSAIRQAFEARRTERLSTATLLEMLHNDEEAPWVTWNRGKPMGARQLARHLAGFGIRSANLRDDRGVVVKGYVRSKFDDAFDRYLCTASNPLPDAATSATTLQTSSDAGLLVADTPTVADAYATEACGDVAEGEAEFEPGTATPRNGCRLTDDEPGALATHWLRRDCARQS